MKAAPLLMLLFLIVSQAGASESFSMGNGKHGSFSDPVLGKFLPVHQAFQASTWRNDGRLYIGFRNAEGYYLHRHQFALESRDSAVSLGALDLPPGELIVHADLGEMYVFYDKVVFSAPIEMAETDSDDPLAITVTFQGCSDAGLCYPPAQLELDALPGSPPAVFASARPSADADIPRIDPGADNTATTFHSSTIASSPNGPH